jgi:hypothetical protein
VRKDIKHLSDELKYMYAFLEKMSAEENPRQNLDDRCAGDVI